MNFLRVRTLVLTIFLTVCSGTLQAYEVDDAIQIQQEVYQSCMNRSTVGRGKALKQDDSIYFALTNRPDGCYPEEINDNTNNIKEMIKEEKARSFDFMRDVTDSALREALVEYMSLEYRFGKEEIDIKQIKKFCNVGGGRAKRNVCSEATIAYIEELVSEFTPEISNIEGREKKSVDEMVTILNGRVDFLNKLIKDVNKFGLRSEDTGMFSSKPILTDETKDLYGNYYLACWQNLKTPIGRLLSAPYLVNKGSMCKLVIDDETHGAVEKNDFYFLSEHKSITAEQLNKAIVSLRNTLGKKLVKAVREYQVVRKQGARLKEDKKIEIVKTQILNNRSSLAESLLVDPYQASLLCGATKSFEKEQKTRKNIEKGTNFIMGASAFFGVGSLVGLTVGFVGKLMVKSALKKGGQVILSKKTAGSLYKGLGRAKTAEKMFSVSSSLAGVSATLALIETPFLYNIYATEKENLKSLQESITRQLFKEMGEDSALIGLHQKSISDAIEKVKDYKFKTILNSAFIPLNVAAAAIAVSQLRNIGQVNAETLDTFARIVNSSDLSAVEVTKLIDRFKLLPEAEAAKFVNTLNQTHLEEQVAMFRSLEEAGMTGLNKSKNQNQSNTAVKIANNADIKLKDLRNALNAIGATPKQSLEFIRYLRFHKLKNKEMALKLIQGLDKARLEQTSRSPMFLADAIRTLTNFSSKNAIATEKIATMLGEWSDAMISGLSFTYKRAGALMSKNPKLTKEQALVSTLRADGLSANNVAKIKNCALF